MKNERAVFLFSLFALSAMGAGCQNTTYIIEPGNSSTTANTTDPTCRVFTDLDAALRDPDAVCELNLRGQHRTGALPSQIGTLRNLKNLYASHNDMTGVPAEVGQLKNLEVLDISDNRITGLPMEIGNLSQLRTFDISGNAYSTMDLDSIAKKIPQANIIRSK